MFLVGDPTDIIIKKNLKRKDQSIYLIEFTSMIQQINVLHLF